MDPFSQFLGYVICNLFLLVCILCLPMLLLGGMGISPGGMGLTMIMGSLMRFAFQIISGVAALCFHLAGELLRASFAAAPRIVMALKRSKPTE